MNNKITSLKTMILKESFGHLKRCVWDTKPVVFLTLNLLSKGHLDAAI